ncbi:DUF7521 family protein [Halorhabdus amylolytica]|uniref:DUF7521 family protein n=1 Tax=Halorhabdus amylolytica TaxID=2559573 RepID=UPI0010A9E89E|nr:hypothetical protein [Halorhabdus amylolytica]
MANPPELWLFVMSNALVLVLGGAMAFLSGRAYQRTGSRSFGLASGGFALLTLGTLVEGIYELGYRRSYELTGRELLALHTVEGVLVAAGLAVLFYSLQQH